MKLPSSRSVRLKSKKQKRYYVDLDKCGGELFLEDFDLIDFCGVLQRVVPDVEIVPITDPGKHAHNPDPTLVSEAEFEAAIVQYCGACSITGCHL